MKKYILFLLGVAIFIISCEKDDDYQNTNTSATSENCIVIKTNNLIDNSYSELSYNEDFKLDNSKRYNTTNTFLDGFNTVYSDGKLIKITVQDSISNDVQIYEYFYNSNEVDSVVKYIDNNGIIDTSAYYIFNYTSGKVTSISTFLDLGSNEFYNVLKKEYTWTGYNISKIKEYSANYYLQLELIRTTTYEFDFYKNYFHNFDINNLPVSTDMLNANNFTKRTIKDSAGTVDNDNSINYNNTYEGSKLTHIIGVNFNNDTIKNETREYSCN